MVTPIDGSLIGAESPGHDARELRGDAHGHRTNCCLASDRWDLGLEIACCFLFVGQIPHFNDLLYVLFLSANSFGKHHNIPNIGFLNT
jgi:hypothetical protein